MCKSPYVSKLCSGISLQNSAYSGYLLGFLQIGFGLALAIYELFDNHTPKYYILVIISIIVMLLGSTLILAVRSANVFIIKLNIIFQVIVWFVGTIGYFIAIPLSFKLLHEFLYFSSQKLGPFWPVLKTSLGKRLIVLAFISIISSALSAYLLICINSFRKNLIKMKNMLLQNVTYTFEDMNNTKTIV